MIELSPTYFTEDQQASKDGMTVTVTFSLTIKHVGMLSQMSQETGIKKSELIRMMIEKTYKNIQSIQEETKIA
jgi:hypothetical protein